MVNRAQFCSGAIRRSKKSNPEVIAEREVPTTSYEGGEAIHSTLKISHEAEELAAKAEVERVIPLTKEVYDSMTPSLQKMTLFGKVVVVTGCVLLQSLFAASRKSSFY
jgi:hypothetical protein